MKYKIRLPPHKYNRERDQKNPNLTVRLLVAGAGARTAKLLRLAATRVRNEEGPVVVHQGLLNLALRRLVDVCLCGGSGVGRGGGE